MANERDCSKCPPGSCINSPALELKVYRTLPCHTEVFAVNGVKADHEWFVHNYDDGDGEQIDYGCNNRVTDRLPIDQVRRNLPEALKELSDKAIERIQDKLCEELCSGGCGWCV